MSDTVCKRCPAGHFSSSDSSAEPCQPHRNCTHLGLKTLRWGSATSDSLCASQDKTAALDCSQHQALCSNGKKLFSWKPSKGGSDPTRVEVRPHEGSDPPVEGRGTQIPHGSELLGAQTEGAQIWGCSDFWGWGSDPGWGFRPGGCSDHGRDSHTDSLAAGGLRPMALKPRGAQTQVESSNL